MNSELSHGTEQADWTEAHKTGNVQYLHPSEDAAYTVYKKLCPPWTVKVFTECYQMR